MFDLTERRSIREFDSQYKISKDEYKKIFTAAMNAPSAVNQKAHEFIVVENREILNKLKDEYKNMHMLESASAAIILVHNIHLMKDQKFEPYYQQDLSAATENILLEAHQIGLGTCWCGVAPSQEKMEFVGKLIGLKEGQKAFNVIAIGKSIAPRPNRNDYNEERISYII